MKRNGDKYMQKMDRTKLFIAEGLRMKPYSGAGFETSHRSNGKLFLEMINAKHVEEDEWREVKEHSNIWKSCMVSRMWNELRHSTGQEHINTSNSMLMRTFLHRYRKWDLLLTWTGLDSKGNAPTNAIKSVVDPQNVENGGLLYEISRMEAYSSRKPRGSPITPKNRKVNIVTVTRARAPANTDKFFVGLKTPKWGRKPHVPCKNTQNNEKKISEELIMLHWC